MKNITLSVDDETYRRARMIAAERNTSVSGLVRALLTGPEIKQHKRDGELDAIFKDLDALNTRFSASDRLPRSQLYDRARRRSSR